MEKETIKKYALLFLFSLMIIVLLVIVFKNTVFKNDTTLVKYYDVMQMEKIDSYTLDVRIYGTEVDNSARVNNYNDEQFRILLRNPDFDSRNPESLRDKEYIVDKGNVYLKTAITEENPVPMYNKVTEELVFKNTNLYLEGLRKAAEVSDPYNTEMGKLDYITYDVTFKKDGIKEMLEELNLNDIKVSGDVEGKVYLKDNYVYRVLYELNDLTINATYFGVNTGRPINLPNEIK